MYSFYSDKAYKIKQSIQTKLDWQKGIHESQKKRAIRICIREGCENKFEVKHSSPKKFCSQKCSAIINNIGRVKIKEKRYCLNCGRMLRLRHKLIYCSNKCQCNKVYRDNVSLWKNGKLSGGVGITSRNIASWLRRYLIEKSNNRCNFCSWGEKHPVTGIVPLEVDHIDGNSENNLESNLRLLCPNCHSLTPYYKNLNKGRGRKWRMEKYIKN